MGQSRFYNDNTSLLSKEVSQSTVWSYFGKHMFETGLLYHRLSRMCIIKCLNSSPNLPQMVLNYSLGMRYVRLCWVDDRATQKALVGDSSPSPARRPMQVVPRPQIRNPR
ncbi:NBS-LRR type resistance protein [Cucumis melo var. makuwa]|uniref:NBS-LRR type resistance protein n=1 Tax=Cucumis melo var. makuwa TaxID=1194695 RepID=A0A5D3DC42_CUCMM|nr:NBS-LRR type resistance protein [Cucumis melo var. makuwa]